MDQNKQSLSVAVGMVLASAILGWAIYASRASTDSVTVKGLASRDVISDTVTWSSAFTRTTPGESFKSGYALMTEDEKRIGKFLEAQGIAKGEVMFSLVEIAQPFRTNEKLPKETTFSEDVAVVSHDVVAVERAMGALRELIDAGLEFQSKSVSYSYSKLSELRVNLLAEAMRDARTRAEKIVEASGQRVGRVSDTSVGAVQILSRDGSGSEWEDSAAKEKQIVVTVNTTFVIK